MPTLSISNVRIAGLAAAVPELTRTSWENLHLPEDLFQSARSRNEIPCVRQAKPEQCQSDFCVPAAQRLLEELDWDPKSVDVVVMATLTPDYPIPATAIIIQDRLQIPREAVAFDLPSGSLGFLHGLQVVASMLGSGHLKRGLLLTGQVSKAVSTQSSVTSTCQIHGHNGAVCGLEFSQGAPPMTFDNGGDGKKLETFYMPVGGVRQPPEPEMFSTPEGLAYASDFVFDSEAMHDFALETLPSSIKRLREVAASHGAKVERYYFDLPSLFSESAVRHSLQIRQDQFFGISAAYGECLSGKIPVAMLAQGPHSTREGKSLSILSSVGCGLGWSSALVPTDGIIRPDIIEI